jgi:hypothetical protein
MGQEVESITSVKLKLFACSLLLFLVALGVSVKQEILANEMDANFDSKFMEIYGLNGDDFFWLGEDGLVGRWLEDEIVETKDCDVYEKCNFVEVATLEGCEFGFSLQFALYDEHDRFLARTESQGYFVRPGDLVIVEIGAAESLEFEYLEPEKAQCFTDGIPV